jgi:hypothetical protein
MRSGLTRTTGQWVLEHDRSACTTSISQEVLIDSILTHFNLAGAATNTTLLTLETHAENPLSRLTSSTDPPLDSTGAVPRSRTFSPQLLSMESRRDKRPVPHQVTHG